MIRRDLRHFLALPVLVATLLCVALPAPALAQHGGKNHGQKADRGRSEQQHRSSDDDYYDDSRVRGDESGRGNSDRSYQRADDDYDRGNGNGRGQKSGRWNARQQQQGDDDYYDEDRGRGDNPGRGRSQKYQSSDDRDDYYGNGRRGQQRYSLSPQQAAQRARSEYGGQVLKVQPAGDGYQVRLLQQDGRVVTVPIGD